MKKNTSDYKRNTAFTLIELLVVMSIIGIFVAATVPLMSSLSRSGDFNQSVIQLSGLFDQARSSAIANNTYVWVAMGEDKAKDGLAVTALASNTGRGNAFATPDVKPIVRPVTLNNLLLGHNLTNGIVNKETVGVDHLSDASGEYRGSFSAFTSRHGDSSKQNFDQIIQFNPQGEVTIYAPSSGQASAPVAWLELGLKQRKGSSVDEDNIAVIQISGLTGKVRVYRP